MSGSDSSAPGSVALPESPLGLTVHAMPAAAVDGDGAAERTRRGRWKMFVVLAVCAAPVVASYLTYFVIRPESRNNYGTLITPPREFPADLPLATLGGAAVQASSLRDQWLLVVVADAACDAGCERDLFLQRQLREALGSEKDRVEKVWLVTGAGTPRPEVLSAIAQGSEPATVLRVPRDALARWLEPASGHAVNEHVYVIDPMGRWMMRMPPEPEPARVKRDIERLLRASASWDRPGR